MVHCGTLFNKQIKKQNDSLSQRNMELMKTNTDLRHKTREQDTHIQELKDKLSEQKRKMEYLVRAKKEMEENVHKMKVLPLSYF